MAVSLLSSDIIEQSFLLRNVQDRTRNRGRRQLHVQGLTGDSGDLDQANTWLASNLADPHPEDTSIPLLTLRSSYWVPGETVSDAIYAHSDISNPTQAPFSFADERFYGFRRMDVPYRVYEPPGSSGSTGNFVTEEITEEGIYVQPNGITLLEGDYTEAVNVYTKDERVPVRQITVPAGRLSASDLDSINDIDHSHNSDWVSINGVERAPETLHYLGPDIRAVDVNGTVKYHTNYVFHWNPEGWGKWKVLKIWILAWAWVVINVAPPNKIAFVDAFPLYDGSTGPSAGSSDSDESGVLPA